MTHPGDQLWVGAGLHPGHFKQPTNDPGFGIKPHGGLWTSTYDPATGSGWVEWCVAEDFRVPEGYRWHAWKLKVPERSTILKIDSYEDLRSVLEDSGFGITGLAYTLRLGGMGLNFEHLATAYDAIWLTERGQWETRLSHPHTLYGWDCESVLWLHWPWAHNEIQYLGVQTWGKARVNTRGRLRSARRNL